GPTSTTVPTLTASSASTAPAGSWSRRTSRRACKCRGKIKKKTKTSGNSNPSGSFVSPLGSPGGNPPKKRGRPWFCRAPSGCPGPGADADAFPVCVSPPHRCRCHSGYVGTRCEHADLLAVVAANQKKQTITALVVVSVVASVLLIGVCVLIHCCRLRKRCRWCRAPGGGPEKPGGLLKGGTSCCHAETGV
uniref:Transforming growth factor alpha n=1 Tax=Aquila chrysaetos chrysaetos TaxID=223781 RepID=A0A663ELF3_AQUCH